MYQSSHAVAVTKTCSYESLEISSAVRRHFELLGLSERIKPGMRVLLKPNLLMKRRPEEFTTTHPAVVGGIAACLIELGVTDITLCDSPGGPYTKQALNSIYEVCGMRAMADTYGIKLNLGTESFERKVPSYKAVSGFTLIKPLEEADFIINIAKLKTHAMTNLSGGVKNLFGTIPGLMKPEFHWRFPQKDRFCEMLVDLCETVRPDVTFVDAIVSMEGDGPSGGTAKQTDLLLSSDSPYDMDLALCKMMLLDTQEVFTVSHSIARGLCPKTADELLFLGDSLPIFDDFRFPRAKGIRFEEHLPRFMQRPAGALVRRFFNSRPRIVKNGCIGCGKCAESCPAKVISIVNKKAIIDYSSCISCFCCHEMCPVKAIKIKRSSLFKL